MIFSPSLISWGSGGSSLVQLTGSGSLPGLRFTLQGATSNPTTMYRLVALPSAGQAGGRGVCVGGGGGEEWMWCACR
jgi:hypothetical protein